MPDGLLAGLVLVVIAFKLLDPIVYALLGGAPKRRKS